MGCEHYRRHCHVRAECCREWVACRLCHDAQFADHEIDRHAVKEMRCDACQTEQPCAQTCSQCHASMGAYFCKVCNLFDDEGEAKQIFHCDGCGICRVGGRDNFFHCAKCCGCYPLSLQDKHKCLEGSMHRECAICLDVTFASLESVHVLPCGHVLHGGCWQEYIRHGHYRCPSCRTRMFWSDDGDGDDGESGDGETADGDDDDDETMDEHDEMSGEEDGEDDGSGGDDEEGSEDGGHGSDDVAGDAQSPSSSLPLAMSSTESGVAQRLVNAIFHALSSSSADGENAEADADRQSEDAAESTHGHRTSESRASQ